MSTDLDQIRYGAPRLDFFFMGFQALEAVKISGTDILIAVG
jgi:hypothetical protein